VGVPQQSCVEPVHDGGIVNVVPVGSRLGTMVAAFVETQLGDNIAKFALALSAAGNVHTRTGRAWTEAEFMKIVSELP